MAVQQIVYYGTATPPRRYLALSTDVKPTTSVPYGSTLEETDTGDKYVYSPAGWSLSQDESVAIKAGATIIGKVGIDQTTDGTTNAVSIKEKTLLHVTGTKAASGDNELIAAPTAGTRIVVSSFQIQLEADTETTLIMKDGATNKFRFLAVGRGGGLNKDFMQGREWKMTAATALNLNLSGANSCGYNVSYYTETV